MDYATQPLGQLAKRIPGATRIFDTYQFDFCCGGRKSLHDAAVERGIDPAVVAGELQALQAQAIAGADRDWDAATTTELIDHILTRYHAVHRQQLPELIRLAARVEQVHGDRPDCPVGLAELLREMHQELESHMWKEEQILFPMLARAAGSHAAGPIGVMRAEHDQHGEALDQLAALTHDITLPAAACNTWRALYLGLRTFRTDLMQHIHLENNILFENAAAHA